MSVPAADVRIGLVSGTNRLTATTDKEGKLDVQVPPGEYTIAPMVAETVRVYGAPFKPPYRRADVHPCTSR